MKILSIGNSFSEDAQTWFEKVCLADKDTAEGFRAENLYIGGCSLELHMSNIKSGAQAYQLQHEGRSTGEMISIADALDRDEWDIVTIQQASHFSGQPQTYYPYVFGIADCIRAHCPDAKIYIQQTWAYEVDSQHGAFPTYDCNTNEMYRRLSDAYETAANLLRLHLQKVSPENADVTILPVGKVVQELRKNPLFDVPNGGRSICRDGFHLSLVYGRYLAAAVWYETIFGKNILENNFVPEIEGHETDMNLISVIKNKVHEICGC